MIESRSCQVVDPLITFIEKKIIFKFFKKLSYNFLTVKSTPFGIQFYQAYLFFDTDIG